MDKAKNDEPKNFAFVTFQREEITRKLVSFITGQTLIHLFFVESSDLRFEFYTAIQVKLGEDVMCGTKIVIKPVILCISHFNPHDNKN